MKKITSTTMFYRNIPQLYTMFDLCEEFKDKINIHFWGCSIGCESYTFLIDYLARENKFLLDIKGFDYLADNIEYAKKGVYDFTPKNSDYNYIRATANDDFPSEIPSYAKKYFKKLKDNFYTIDANHPVIFETRNFLKKEDFLDLEKSHITVCQNALIHLSDEEAFKALENLYNNTKKDGYLIIGGTEEHVISEFVQSKNMEPYMKNFTIIYDSFIQRAKVKNEYYHMEDIDKTKPDWKYRYGTIFKKV